MTRVSVRAVRKQKIEEYSRETTKGLRRAISRAVTMVQKTAVESIQQGAKSGILYRKYNPNRVHRASAAGEPPASDTGFLANNILFQIDTDGLAGSVDSRAGYSSYLEFGTRTLAARPFMQPALEQNKNKIKAMIASEIKKAKDKI